MDNSDKYSLDFLLNYCADSNIDIDKLAKSTLIDVRVLDDDLVEDLDKYDLMLKVGE